MKKLTLIICLTLVSGFAFSQWIEQKTSDILYSVYFPDANTGYAVGGHHSLNGKTEPTQIILKTINGGTTWETLTSGTSGPLYSVFFTDINTGYAVGNGIIKTTDGGSTWVELPSGTFDWLFSVFFTDANTGYVVGNGGIILKTTDGGSNWAALRSYKTERGLTSVFFTNAVTGYAVGGSTILRTIDGGSTWDALSSGITEELSSIFFTNINTGYAVGNGIIKTTDGGSTWVELPTGTTNGLRSVFFTNVNTGYVLVGNYSTLPMGDGKILKTIDGGATWTELSTGITEGGLTSFFFTNADTGYAVGGIWFPSDGNGCCVGTILKTTNGGGFPNVIESVSQESDFTVYPNPGTNKISIATNSNKQEETTICIFNMNGAILQQEKFQSQNLIELDVSSLAKGIYLLQIHTKAGIETKKLVVQ